MAAPSSRARISWQMATKFLRPKSNFGASHEFPGSRPRRFRGVQIRPRSCRVFLTPYLQPYSEVASGYSPGNCAHLRKSLSAAVGIYARIWSSPELLPV